MGELSLDPRLLTRNEDTPREIESDCGLSERPGGTFGNTSPREAPSNAPLPSQTTSRQNETPASFTSADGGHTEEPPHVDVHRWLVLGAAFLCRLLSGGYAVSMGIFFVEFLDTFESGRGLTGWVISLSGGLMYGAGVPVSFILHRTNERACCVLGALVICAGLCSSYVASSTVFLVLSFGITTGIGMSFVLSSCATAVSHHFSRGQGAATAVSESGLTVGGLLFPFLLRFLIDTYTWRGAVLISAAILLNILPLGLFFAPSRRAKGLSDTETATGTNSDKTSGKYCQGICQGILQSKLFVLYVIVSVVVATGNAYVYAIIVDLGTVRGYGVVNSTYLVLALSAANILGVVIMAGLLKLFWNGASWLYVINITTMAVSMFVFPLTNSYTTLVLGSVLYGMTAGGLYGTYISIVSGLLDKEFYTVGTGFTCSAYGLGTALSTPIAGWLTDLSGDYNNSFFVGGGLCLGAVLIFAVVLLIQACREISSGSIKGDNSGSTVVVNKPLSSRTENPNAEKTVGVN